MGRTPGRSKSPCRVSIQLIAPASGASKTKESILCLHYFCFHSTDCPSEWGPESEIIAMPIKWLSFHETDCPSEWGLEVVSFVGHSSTAVSIQLIAPASGADLVCYPSIWDTDAKVSIQLIAPASGAHSYLSSGGYVLRVSIQLIAPASGA